jgi:uncharacterized protein (TIGR03067 family)
MHTQVAWVAWAGLLLAAGQAPDVVRADKERLQGTWVLQEVRYGSIDAKGKDVRKRGSKDWQDLRLTFAGDRVTLRGWGEPQTVTSPYKLNPTRSPKELDIERGAPTKEFIYQLDGGRLFVALPVPELVAGGTFAERQRHIRRPRDFKETKETAPPIILVLKRVKH